jgi:hypothetical protein
MNGVAVVTAVAGDYDHPRDDVFTKGVDYLFFADAETPSPAPPWERLELANAEPNPRRRAKGPKLNPHRFARLREYEYVIWVDGGVHIRSPNLIGDLLAEIRNGMAISPHFDDRHCAYGEATITSARYPAAEMEAQVAYYRSRGFPTDYGLYEGGVLAREMAHPVVPELGALWQAQVERWSVQDQVSLPYCLWLLRYEPGVLPVSFREMGVLVNAHKGDEQCP